MLFKYKSNYINEQIAKNKGDTKHLVSSLTGIKNDNPLPESKSDTDLAERFASFFTEKIEKIRNDLNSHPLYKPDIN